MPLDLFAIVGPQRQHVLGFGPELVANGGFDTDTVWVKVNATIALGVANLGDGIAAAANVNQPIILVAGALYRVQFDVTAYTSGSVRPTFIGGTAVSGTLVSAVGSYSENMIAVTGNNELRMAGVTTPVLSIDNMSLTRIG